MNYLPSVSFMNKTSLFNAIHSFYNTSSITKNEDDLKLIEKDIETLEGIEINEFAKKIHELIIEVKLNKLTEYLNLFKIYFKDYIKYDISKLDILSFDKKIQDDETSKIFKIIINDYPSLIENNLNFERLNHFAQFLNITIDENEAKTFLKFIQHGNKNGGWKDYNYSLINLNELI